MSVPHSLAGFIGYHTSYTGKHPTEREIWDAAIRSYRDLQAAPTIPKPSSLCEEGETGYIPGSCAAKVRANGYKPVRKKI